jgi:hypothetical protein
VIVSPFAFAYHAPGTVFLVPFPSSSKTETVASLDDVGCADKLRWRARHLVGTGSWNGCRKVKMEILVACKFLSSLLIVAFSKHLWITALVFFSSKPNLFDLQLHTIIKLLSV